MQVKGAVVHTFARGRHVFADGDLRAEPGMGRYLPRKPFGAAYDGEYRPSDLVASSHQS